MVLVGITLLGRFWAEQIIYVTSFLVFHTKVTVNIGLKDVVRMVTLAGPVVLGIFFFRAGLQLFSTFDFKTFVSRA